MTERKERAVLAETRGLVEMLEFLLANQSETAPGLPVSGIRLTLRQVHERLIGLEDAAELRAMGDVPVARALRQQAAAEAAGPGEDEGGGVEQAEGAQGGAGAGTLAARIQMAPLPRASRRGYSRELGSPETPKQQEPASVE